MDLYRTNHHSFDTARARILRLLGSYVCNVMHSVYKFIPATVYGRYAKAYVRHGKCIRFGP